MPRTLPVIARPVSACVLVLVLQVTALAQKVELVQFPSGQHIELQPMDDHYRVHIQVQLSDFEVDDAPPRQLKVALTAVQYTTGVANGVPIQQVVSSSSAHEFQLTAADEVWEFYLQTPLPSQDRCQYTLTVQQAAAGDAQPAADPRPLTGFRWIVQRDVAGAPTIVVTREGRPIPIEYEVARPIIETHEREQEVRLAPTPALGDGGPPPPPNQRSTNQQTRLVRVVVPVEVVRYDNETIQYIPPPFQIGVVEDRRAIENGTRRIE